MRVAVLFATTENQTRKIASVAAEHLMAAGHNVLLSNVAEADHLDVDSFDALIFGASIHVGDYQSEFVAFLREHGPEIRARPNLFLSVSLAAAASDPDDWAGLDRVVARLTEKTGWTADKVAHIAGAFRFSRYGFFETLAMRWIAHQRGVDVDPDDDAEFTDWDALEKLVTSWANGLDGAAQ